MHGAAPDQEVLEDVGLLCSNKNRVPRYPRLHTEPGHIAMKLPETLPRLEEPYYVLSPPALAQWLMAAMVVFAPPAWFVWLYTLYRSGSIEVPHYLVAVVLLGTMLAGLSSPNLFRRWVFFAADRKGIYIGNMRWEYIFVPWSEVGESSVGTASSKPVLLELKVSDEVWRRIVPPHPLRVAGISGDKKFAVGNQMRNVEKVREDIERIRRIAIGEHR